MKMGTIALPWRYDPATRNTRRAPNLRWRPILRCGQQFKLARHPNYFGGTASSNAAVKSGRGRPPDAISSWTSRLVKRRSLSVLLRAIGEHLVSNEKRIGRSVEVLMERVAAALWRPRSALRRNGAAGTRRRATTERLVFAG